MNGFGAMSNQPITLIVSQWRIIFLFLNAWGTGKTVCERSTKACILPLLFRWTNEIVLLVSCSLHILTVQRAIFFCLIVCPPSSLLAFDSSESKWRRNFMITMDAETKNTNASGARLVSVSRRDFRPLVDDVTQVVQRVMYWMFWLIPSYWFSLFNFTRVTCNVPM